MAHVQTFHIGGDQSLSSPHKDNGGAGLSNAVIDQRTQRRSQRAGPPQPPTTLQGSVDDDGNVIGEIPVSPRRHTKPVAHVPESKPADAKPAGGKVHVRSQHPDQGYEQMIGAKPLQDWPNPGVRSTKRIIYPPEHKEQEPLPVDPSYKVTPPWHTE